MIAVDGQNHGTIVSNPEIPVRDLIFRFLNISDEAAYAKWEADALAFGQKGLAAMNAESAHYHGGAGWQQLAVHMVDDHGDSVTDYNLQLYIGDSLSDSDDGTIHPVRILADTYSNDGSYRCFYIPLTTEMLDMNKQKSPKRKMWLEVIASSGSKLIQYEAYTGFGDDPQPLTIDHNNRGKPVKLEITSLALGSNPLLRPYTTTLLEIFVEREPWPLDRVSDLFNFLGH